MTRNIYVIGMALHRLMKKHKPQWIYNSNNVLALYKARWNPPEQWAEAWDMLSWSGKLKDIKNKPKWVKKYLDILWGFESVKNEEILYGAEAKKIWSDTFKELEEGFENKS